MQDFSHLGVFDVIFSRNVLIYFDQDTKIGVFNRLAKSLEPDGVLALGAAESVVGITDAFKPCPERRGLYRPNPARDARSRRRAEDGCRGGRLVACPGRSAARSPLRSGALQSRGRTRRRRLVRSRFCEAA
jgi:hypothetical protein